MAFATEESFYTFEKAVCNEEGHRFLVCQVSQPLWDFFFFFFLLKLNASVKCIRHCECDSKALHIKSVRKEYANCQRPLQPNKRLYIISITVNCSSLYS